MTKVQTAYRYEIERFRLARNGGDVALAWRFLERAHILSQTVLRLHLHVHAIMFVFAISHREWREAWGQVFRLLLAPLGSLLRRIPLGNTGRAAVSAFIPMPIPEDLQRIMDDGRT